MGLYPSLVEKAAVVAWRIIAGHIFHDGNKRTGLEVCRQILERGGLHLPIDREALSVALEIARGALSLEEFTDWLGRRVLQSC